VTDDPERPAPGTDEPPRRRPPRQKEWASAIDEIIRAAQEAGSFDNLPGRGRPLHWDTGHDDPEWWLAHHLLRSSGYLPDWIERDKEIRAERARLARRLDAFVAWYRDARSSLTRAALGADEAAPGAADLEIALERVTEEYRERADALNEKIDRFNLAVPLPQLQRLRVRVDVELTRFVERLGQPPNRH